MNAVTEKIFELCPSDYATDTVIANLAAGSADRLKGLVKRAIAKQELIHVRRGLYCLGAKFQKQGINPFTLAQLIYGPSYISLEMALSYHGWIPEAVYAVTSVCSKVSKEFSTDIGLFSYVRIPQKELYACVQRVDDGHGGFFFMASPIKALADYVYVYKKDWKGIHPVIESLRIEHEDLQKTTTAEMDELLENYNSKRVKQFIEGLKKDLGYEH
jgi:hypothetical protein